jgi:hypothetical protein
MPHGRRLSFISHIDCPFTEKRKAEAERIRQKYPDRIPVRILAVTAPMCSSTQIQHYPTGHLREGG